MTEEKSDKGQPNNTLFEVVGALTFASGAIKGFCKAQGTELTGLENALVHAAPLTLIMQTGLWASSIPIEKRASIRKYVYEKSTSFSIGAGAGAVVSALGFGISYGLGWLAGHYLR